MLEKINTWELREIPTELQTLKKEVTDWGDPKIPTPQQKEEIKRISSQWDNFDFVSLEAYWVIPWFTIDKVIRIIRLNPSFDFDQLRTCIKNTVGEKNDLEIDAFDIIVEIVDIYPDFSFANLAWYINMWWGKFANIREILTYDSIFDIRETVELNTALKALRQTLERETFIQLKKNNFNSEILVDSNWLWALVDIHGLKKIVTYNLDVDELVDIIKQKYNATYMNYITLWYQTKKKELFDRLKEEDYWDDPNVKKNVVYLHTCRSTIAERKADIIKPANPIHKTPDGTIINFNAVTGEVFGAYNDDINTLENNIGINTESMREIIRNIIQTILDDPTSYEMLDPQNNPPSALYSIAMAIYRTQTHQETIPQAFDRIITQRKAFEKMNLIDHQTTVFVNAYEYGDKNYWFLWKPDDSFDPNIAYKIGDLCQANIWSDKTNRGNKNNLDNLANNTDIKTTLFIKGHGGNDEIDMKDEDDASVTPQDLISVYNLRYRKIKEKNAKEQKEPIDDWMILTACYSYDFVIKFYDLWRNNPWFKLYNILPPKCIVNASQNKESLKATEVARIFLANQMAQKNKTLITWKDMITIESQNFILSGYESGNDTWIFVPDEKFWNEKNGGNGSNGEIGITGNNKDNDYDPNITADVSVW
jgi:predicted nucleic-acid-binding protein